MATDRVVDYAIDKTIDVLVPGPTPKVTGEMRELLGTNNEVAKKVGTSEKIIYNKTSEEE